MINVMTLGGGTTFDESLATQIHMATGESKVLRFLRSNEKKKSLQFIFSSHAASTQK
jgi:hypothetical protein